MIHNSKNSNNEPNTKMITIIFIIVLLLSSNINGSLAQDHNIGVKNAGQKIVHADDINMISKAVPLNNSINSPYDDIKPAVAPCGKRLYFSRHRHPNNTFGINDLEDIWYSQLDESSGTWSEPILMTGDLNNSGPNYINNVSTTGDTVILGNQYKKNGKMRAGLSYSVSSNGQWSFPIAINIENDYNIAEQENSFVSLRNGVIIRAIQRTETYGGRDLYVSFWDGQTASEPVNMGGVINSDMEESSPFLAADNKTLYFASKGHSGYGASDIYVTHRLDETWTNWSAPRNLGPAVNGPMDDEFFSITHCGNFAVFSKEVSVHNTDLYRISMDELFIRQQGPTVVPPTTQQNTAFASL